MKKIAVGIVISLFIGGALVEAGTRLAENTISNIEQKVNQGIDNMLNDIDF